MPLPSMLLSALTEQTQIGRLRLDPPTPVLMHSASVGIGGSGPLAGGRGTNGSEAFREGAPVP
jgi:hypothetical protein